jgi:CPA2 family monovalent cation:H+ antiporter-2
MGRTYSKYVLVLYLPPASSVRNTGRVQEIIFLRDLATALLAAAIFAWILQRIGFSSVVGYLLAGVAIGPFSPVVQLVEDLNHIQILAQIGLVFLMFGIGLGLSFARLQRMGLSIFAAVIISSIFLFNLCRLFGVMMEWNSFQTFFLAGTLMISSSAIIVKILDELNITHQRAGQLALGVTVLEDIVAVVMLTLFLSMLKVGAAGANAESTSFWQTLGALGAFVVFLLVVATIAVPRILNWLARDNASELKVLTVTALVLFGSFAAVRAGYSTALGAFLLGAVIAGTRHKDEIEKSFASLQNIFGAIFFVAVGMMFDVRLLLQVWWLVAIVTLLTLIARPLACAFGLVAIGHSSRNSLKAGLALIPVGEFAFVMIQVGKSANILPEVFYALAIGVSLATAVIGPLLTRRSEAICNWIEAHEPRALRETIQFYHRWLAEFHVRSNASILWKLCSKRILHIAVHLLFVSALIIFSRPLLNFARDLLKNHSFLGELLPMIFWPTFVAVLLGPMIAIWRNMEALSMIMSEGVARNSTRSSLQPLLQNAFKLVSGIILVAWILLLVPFGLWTFWALCIVTAVLLIFAPFLWRRLIKLHSRFEFDFREKMKAASTLGSNSGLSRSVLEQPQEWNLEIDEVTLPFRTEHAGRCIADLALRRAFGVSIMAIDRQGHLICNPDGVEKLYANDKLLLLGGRDQLSDAEQLLRGTNTPRGSVNVDFDQIAMETVMLPPTLGEPTLSELNLASRYGLQICGIERAGKRTLIPSFAERLFPGDRLLVLGTHDRIQRWRSDLAEPAVQPEVATA